MPITIGHPRIIRTYRSLHPALTSQKSRAPWHAQAARSRMQDRAAISCTPVAAPKVMGLYEIATRLGISKRYARELAGRKGFPEGTRLHMGQVWAAADVESWIAKNRPQH